MPEPPPKEVLAERIEDWYRSVSIDPTGEILAARRQSIEAITEDIDAARALDVVAYAHGRHDWRRTNRVIRQRGAEFDPDFRRRARLAQGDGRLRLAHHLAIYASLRSAQPRCSSRAPTFVATGPRLAARTSLVSPPDSLTTLPPSASVPDQHRPYLPQEG